MVHNDSSCLKKKDAQELALEYRRNPRSQSQRVKQSSATAPNNKGAIVSHTYSPPRVKILAGTFATKITGITQLKTILNGPRYTESGYLPMLNRLKYPYTRPCARMIQKQREESEHITL